MAAPPTSAELNSNIGMAVDTTGNLFIADYGNNVVREVVKATGNIITVAGNGKAGYSGNKGLATAAELNGPRDLAFDPSGNLYISDMNNNVVREVVKATGYIYTYVGNHTAGYSGNNGPATAAELNSPRGIAIDSAGNLFIADLLNNVIREVVASTDDIITYAGNHGAGYSGDNGPATSAKLNQPNTVALDTEGDLYIADALNYAIREVVKATVDIITFAGDGIAGYGGDNGPATSAELNGAFNVAVDTTGNVFIGDGYNNREREVIKATGEIITVAGSGTAGYSGDNGPATAAEVVAGRVAVDSAGDVFFNGTNVVREFTTAVSVTIAQATTSTAAAMLRPRSAPPVRPFPSAPR